MSVNLSFNGTLNATDSVTGTIAMSKVLTALSTLGTVYTDAQQVSIGTSPTSVAIPVSPCTFLYIKNTHATNTLTVTWTPNGGASNPVITLQAGAAIMFTEPISGNGITALSLTASGASTSVEYCIGG